MQNNKYILIDIGTASVKVYKYENGILNNILRENIYLNDGYSEEYGLPINKLNELIRIINGVKESYLEYKFYVFGTSAFRTLEDENRNKVLKHIFNETNININVISTYKEGEYISKAVLNQIKRKENVLIVNIGAGSTEQILIENNEIVQEVHMEFGSEKVAKKFPSTYKMDKEIFEQELKDYILNNIEYIDKKSRYVIITGGILKLVKTVGYEFESDNIFFSTSELAMIELEELSAYNSKFVNKINKKDLNELFVENPKLAAGTLSACLILECICEHMQAEKIIFSEKNLIDGVILELMN